MRDCRDWGESVRQRDFTGKNAIEAKTPEQAVYFALHSRENRGTGYHFNNLEKGGYIRNCVKQVLDKAAEALKSADILERAGEIIDPLKGSVKSLKSALKIQSMPSPANEGCGIHEIDRATEKLRNADFGRQKPITPGEAKMACMAQYIHNELNKRLGGVLEPTGETKDFPPDKRKGKPKAVWDKSTYLLGGKLARNVKANRQLLANSVISRSNSWKTLEELNRELEESGNFQWVYCADDVPTKKELRMTRQVLREAEEVEREKIRQRGQKEIYCGDDVFSEAEIRLTEKILAEERPEK